MANEVWANRIVGHADVDPSQLLGNPKNYRRHPAPQQQALLGLIERGVGFIDPVIVQHGSDVVLDGHLRVELALRTDQPTIPVTYVDLTDDEANLALASIDPISAMAYHDAAQLDALLREAATDDAAVQDMLRELEESAGIVPPDWSDAMGALPDGDKAPFEQMTFTVSTRQAETIREALARAKGMGSFDSDNENSNGNALARIAEAYTHA